MGESSRGSGLMIRKRAKAWLHIQMEHKKMASGEKGVYKNESQ
jgi:hypothetical protein